MTRGPNFLIVEPKRREKPGLRFRIGRTTMYKMESPAIFKETETQMSPKLFEDHVEPLIEAHKRSLAREVAEGDAPTVKKLNEKFWEEFGENAPAQLVTFFEALLQSKKLLANVEQIRKNWQETKDKQ